MNLLFHHGGDEDHEDINSSFPLRSSWVYKIKEIRDAAMKIGVMNNPLKSVYKEAEQCGKAGFEFL
ncbi:MAG: hypothetical protein MI799_21915, partial [Desulfobacterales bacterium]|nr:hypothetical protein [Desulfobacterales bacterium]